MKDNQGVTPEGVGLSSLRDEAACASSPKASIPNAAWRFNPANYAVGDPLYLQVTAGWSSYDARKYTVTKKTPTGRIEAVNAAGQSIRLTNRGSVVGEGSYGRSSVCSAERALKLRRDARLRAIWQRIRSAGEAIERAARKEDDDALSKALAELASAIEARRAETAQTGSVHESAVGDSQDAQGEQP